MDTIQDAAIPHFKVIQPGETDLLGLPYDFHSVTHYGPYQYAINTSLPTITTNVSGFSFDKRDTLSFYDVLKVQTLYKCPKGYTMFDKDVNRFNQTPADRYYPQWSFTSDKLRDYMNTTCDREGNYTLTALNGAKWISKFPLPPSGNFCVSVCICIASSSSKIKSYIQLTTMEGLDISKLNYTQPSGHWDRMNTTYTSEQEWTMLVKAHIMWGGDVLALSNMVITNGVCGM
ncbi:uncharacterized protein LOC110441917 [Mizuhopecten yessoensis]|uniref:uncharacterized protein LOC110441917 n=1 Tax=Mizuhopecten yessoensis TaxID=6573 RepID=UPI000B45F86C|nr:uncharacterized protein LOC110441917 [Mizuhopecten yessoensis]